MHRHITVHNPQPRRELPAHEQAARRARNQTAQLPGVPSHTRTPRPVLHSGRKTVRTMLPVQIHP